MTAGESTGAAAPDGKQRRRRRRSWWARVHFVIIGASAAYVVLKMALVAAFGPHALHDALGEEFYNHWVAGGDFDLVILPLLGLLAADLFVLAILFLLHLARTPVGAVVATLIVLSAAAGVVSLVVRVWSVPDPVGDQVWALLLPTDTAYAPGYSSEAFMAVEPGMQRSEVVALIGPPLDWPPWVTESTQYAYYSRSPSSTNYWQRVVVYGLDDRVERVVAELWFD